VILARRVLVVSAVALLVVACNGSSEEPDATAPVPITPLANTTFDMTNLALSSGAYTISLQPIASPGLGVLAPAGNFLIPTLFLTLDDGSSLLDFALPNIVGQFFGASQGCPHEYCLTTDLQIDTGPGGLLDVSIYAIPEPSTALLVAVGLSGLALQRRRLDR